MKFIGTMSVWELNLWHYWPHHILLPIRFDVSGPIKSITLIGFTVFFEKANQEDSQP
jgi:hypothetical protein